MTILHLTQQSYMKRESWSSLREIFLHLATNLRKYADMLLQKNEKSQATHASKKSFFPSSEKSSIEILDAKISTKPTMVARYKSISEAVASSKPYDAICVNDYAPADKWPRHQYMKKLTCAVHYTHTASGAYADVVTVVTSQRLNLLQGIK